MKLLQTNRTFRFLQPVLVIVIAILGFVTFPLMIKGEAYYFVLVMISMGLVQYYEFILISLFLDKSFMPKRTVNIKQGSISFWGGNNMVEVPWEDAVNLSAAVPSAYSTIKGIITFSPPVLQVSFSHKEQYFKFKLLVGSDKELRKMEKLFTQLFEKRNKQHKKSMI